MSKKRGFTVPLPVSILLMPVLLPAMFIAAGLSIPFTHLVRKQQRRRAEKLEAELTARGRVIGWNDFLQAINYGRGTLIQEYVAPKDGRLWWTPEDIYQRSPHPVIDAFTMTEDPLCHPFAFWCRQQYTDPEVGRALLVSLKGRDANESRKLAERLRSKSDTTRRVEVGPRF